jgi:tetratricopeptide (TPR) repeat protein
MAMAEPPAEMPDPPRSLVAGTIPREPPGFQTRAALLAELDRAGGSGPLAVTGEPGAGATQLAAAYARARLAQGWRLVAWVSAADTAALAGGLAAVADAAGLSGDSAGRDGGDRGQLVRRWLEADGDRCLLVFDDVADPESVRPYLPAGGAARVILTGRREPDLGTGVAVGAFSAEEAQAFLAGRAGLARAAADEVAGQLGHLPLALAQAAAVIAGRRLEHGAYLAQLRDMSPAEDPPGPAQAVLMSLNAARAAAPDGVCAGAMELMSVLSGAGVRRDLLHAAGQKGVLAGGRRVAAAQVDAALDLAAGWSLLTSSLDGQVMLVHHLVAGVIRHGLARRRRLAAVCRGAASVLEARAEALAGSPDRPAVRDVTEQVAALADAAGPALGSDEVLARSLLRLRFLALYHLIELGDSAAQAIAVGESLTADLERVLGPDHRDTLNSQNSLAAAYQAANQPAEAIPLFEQILVVRERLLGPEHSDTLTTQNNLAACYQAAGRAGEARLLFELTLAARERLLGPSHPSTLNSLGNLAAAYRDEGRTDDALRLFEQTLKGREAVLGADHTDTVSSRVNLAAAYRQAGRIADAIPLVERTLATRERMLGPSHTSTLATRNNLAAAYREAGRIDEAVPLFEQTLADCERLLGPDHPRTLRSRNSLATCYLAANQAAEAIPLLEQTLAARDRILGAGHKDTMATRKYLALAREAADRPSRD